MLNKSYFWIGLPLLILSLSITLIGFFAFKFLPAKLPLFYSLPWGQAQLATHEQFIIIPAGISAITLINIVISWQLHPLQSFFKKTLLISSVVTGVILAVSFIKIILNYI